MTHLLKKQKRAQKTTTVAMELTETKCENRKEMRVEMGSKWANDVQKNCRISSQHIWLHTAAHVCVCVALICVYLLLFPHVFSAAAQVRADRICSVQPTMSHIQMYLCRIFFGNIFGSSKRNHISVQFYSKQTQWMVISMCVLKAIKVQTLSPIPSAQKRFISSQ